MDASLSEQLATWVVDVGATLDRIEAETAELRDEVHALANRIEGLTHVVSQLTGRRLAELHSVKVPE